MDFACHLRIVSNTGYKGPLHSAQWSCRIKATCHPPSGLFLSSFPQAPYSCLSCPSFLFFSFFPLSCLLSPLNILHPVPLVLLGYFLWMVSLGLGPRVPLCLVWSAGESEHSTAPVLVFTGLTGRLVVLIFTTHCHILSIQFSSVQSLSRVQLFAIGCTNWNCIIQYKLLLANSLSSFFHSYFKSFTWLGDLVGPSLLMFIIPVNHGNKQEEYQERKCKLKYGSNKWPAAKK